MPASELRISATVWPRSRFHPSAFHDRSRCASMMNMIFLNYAPSPFHFPEPFDKPFSVIPDAIVQVDARTYMVGHNAEPLPDLRLMVAAGEVKVSMFFRHSFEGNLRIFGDVTKALFAPRQPAIARECLRSSIDDG